MQELHRESQTEGKKWGMRDGRPDCEDSSKPEPYALANRALDAIGDAKSIGSRKSCFWKES